MIGLISANENPEFIVVKVGNSQQKASRTWHSEKVEQWQRALELFEKRQARNLQAHVAPFNDTSALARREKSGNAPWSRPTLHAICDHMRLREGPAVRMSVEILG